MNAYSARIRSAEGIASAEDSVRSDSSVGGRCEVDGVFDVVIIAAMIRNMSTQFPANEIGGRWEQDGGRRALLLSV